MQRSGWMMGVCLVLGVAGLSMAWVHRSRAVAWQQELATLRAAHIARPDHDVSSAAGSPAPLRTSESVPGEDARIAALEAKLAEREAEIGALRAAATRSTPAVVVPDAVATPVATNAPRRSWLEDLQATDPERYQEIVARREQARQEARYDIAKKASYFLQTPTDAMTDAEAEEYARMMDLLTQSLKLTERLDAGLPQEQRRELVGTLRDNMRELSPLLEKERDKEFFQVGKDLGYTDADARAFADYLTEVIDLTSVNQIFRNAMRGMGGGRGGWGDGPPPTGGPGR